MSTNTQPADSERSSFCQQIKQARKSLYKNLLAALRADGHSPRPDLAAVRAAVYARGFQPHDTSALHARLRQRLQSLLEQLTPKPVGDPHFLAFCSAVAEMLLTA